MAIAGELLEAGYPVEAEPYLDRAIRLDPSHPEPHVVKATMWLDLSKLTEAQRELAEAERLALGRKEFDAIREEIRDLKQEIRETQRMTEELGELPPGLGRMPPELVRLLGRYARR